jgi:PPOX class probable F420-dependent enzyme
MAREMTHDEWRAFVLAAPARTAKLATVRPDGRPHVAPIWIDLDDDDTIVFNTGENTVKGRGLRADPRVSLCFDDEAPPFSFVIIDGAAELSTDLDEMRVWATRIGGRSMGAVRADEYGRRNAVPGELLVRVRPEKVVARADIAD